jgi:hypothetical protein
MGAFLLAWQQGTQVFSGPNSEENLQPHLIARDSIRLAMGEGIGLVDISPNGKHLLVLNYPSELLQIYDTKSKQISSSILMEGKPWGGLASLIQWPSFFDDNQLLIPLYKGIVITDLEGNIQSEYLFKAADPIQFSNMRHTVQPIEMEGELHFLLNQFEFPSNQMTDRRRYQKWRSLLFFKPISGQLESVLPLPEDSRYHDGMVYNFDFLRSTFIVINDTLWHNTAGDPILHAYANDGLFTHLGRIELDLMAYDVPMAISPTHLEANKPRIFPHIGGVKRLFPFNDDIAVLYYPGLSIEQQKRLETLLDEKNNTLSEWYGDAIASITHRLQIVSKSGELKLDVEIPSSFNARSLKVRNGEIWVQNLAEESNYFPNTNQFNMIYKLELVNHEG